MYVHVKKSPSNKKKNNVKDVGWHIYVFYFFIYIIFSSTDLEMNWSFSCDSDRKGEYYSSMLGPGRIYTYYVFLFNFFFFKLISPLQSVVQTFNLFSLNIKCAHVFHHIHTCICILFCCIYLSQSFARRAAVSPVSIQS